MDLAISTLRRGFGDEAASHSPLPLGGGDAELILRGIEPRC